MEHQKQFIVTVAGGSVLGLSLIGLSYWQSGRIAEDREQITQLETQINAEKALILNTGELENEVILQRETDEVARRILPNDEDILNFVRLIEQFASESGIRITSIKDKTPDNKSKNKNDFDRVLYNVDFDADIFQAMAFLDQIESHERLMRVPTIRLKAAKRDIRDTSDLAPPHSVTMEIETYVYQPNGGTQAIRINDYDRKRDMLRTDITARQRELRIEDYDYAGARKRRDPWVDPRVPADPSGARMTIEEQNSIVDALVERVSELEVAADSFLAAQTLVAEMKARTELDKILVPLQQDIERVRQEGQLLFGPAERRFENDVIAELERITKSIAVQTPEGPHRAALEEAREGMIERMQRSEYEEALSVFLTVQSKLAGIEIDEFRRDLVSELQVLAQQCQAVLDFNELGLQIDGIVDLGDKGRAVLIGGWSYLEGELIQTDLLVQTIKSEEVDLVFRGVVLTLPFTGK